MEEFGAVGVTGRSWRLKSKVKLLLPVYVSRSSKFLPRSSGQQLPIIDECLRVARWEKSYFIFVLKSSGQAPPMSALRPGMVGVERRF